MQTEPAALSSRSVDQTAAGKAHRQVVPRRSHRIWSAPANRAEPVELLRAQDEDRLDELVPIRWGRMSVSPFAFYRGSAALMAADLATLPRTELTAQLCGDAHLSNFGLYASPERALMFDVNDFDETHPGPFEWDVKRLAASLAIAGRNNGLPDEAGRAAARAAARSYRTHMTTYAAMRELDVWYSRVVADDLLASVRSKKIAKPKVVNRAAATTARTLEKARARTSAQAATKLTELAAGRPRIVDQPPLITHPEGIDRTEMLRLFRQYTRTMSDERRLLMQRFEVVDVAHKVVGVGSVGTRCFIVLLMGHDNDDPLLLQVKEAGKSVLEPHLGASQFKHSGHRVVVGQRLIQAASDIFLGWMTGRPAGRHFYWRQLRDMKGSVEVERLGAAGLELYAEICGWALARGHARSGQRMAIAAYLGSGDAFDAAIADFAMSYADQAERDFAELQGLIKLGKVPVTTGV